MRYLTLFIFGILSLSANGQNDLYSLSGKLNKGKTYGSYCGFAGQHPPTRIALEELVQAKDITTLKEWIDSPNDVVRTYAAEGFIRLYNKGIKLNAEVIDVIDILKESQTQISSCSGCIYMQITIAEALVPFEWEDRA